MHLIVLVGTVDLDAVGAGVTEHGLVLVEIED
jgi:hypothetical protein